MASAAHLDTHIVLWMHDGFIDKLSDRQTRIIETNDLYISEFVRFELQYLNEVGKINLHPETIINRLVSNAELRLSSCPLNILIDEAIKMHWTRDPFDRLITANAKVEKAVLLTKDNTILKNCTIAIG